MMSDEGAAEIAAAINNLAQAQNNVADAIRNGTPAHMATRIPDESQATQEAQPSKGTDPNRTVACRDCGDLCFWGTTHKEKQILLDAEPNPNGEKCVFEGKVQRYSDQYTPGATRYSCHWDKKCKNKGSVNSWPATPADEEQILF